MIALSRCCYYVTGGSVFRAFPSIANSKQNPRVSTCDTPCTRERDCQSCWYCEADKVQKAGRSGLIRENVAARKLSAVTRVLFQLLKVETNLCDFIRVAFYKSEFWKTEPSMKLTFQSKFQIGSNWCGPCSARKSRVSFLVDTTESLKCNTCSPDILE